MKLALPRRRHRRAARRVGTHLQPGDAAAHAVVQGRTAERLPSCLPAWDQVRHASRIIGRACGPGGAAAPITTPACTGLPSALLRPGKARTTGCETSSSAASARVPLQPAVRPLARRLSQRSRRSVPHSRSDDRADLARRGRGHAARRRVRWRAAARDQARR